MFHIKPLAGAGGFHRAQDPLSPSAFADGRGLMFTSSL